MPGGRCKDSICKISAGFSTHRKHLFLWGIPVGVGPPPKRLESIGFPVAAQL